MTKIDELTPEQELLIETYYETWIEEGHSIKPLDEKLIKTSTKDLWALFDLPAPTIYLTTGPLDAIKKAQELGDKRTKQEIRNDFIYGTWDFYWTYHYRFGLELDPNMYEKSDQQEIETVIAFAKAVPLCLCYDNAIIVSARPIRLTFAPDERLHNDSVAAIEYADGTAIYAWNDVNVPEWVILYPEKITVDIIEAEANAEIRRIMIERYGLQRYLIDSKAEIIHKDTDPQNGDQRVLYRKEVKEDEPIIMVHVKNSTPEPDGSIKDYFIRVPPAITTAGSAVAWTFGLNESEYRPRVQT